MDDAQFGSVMRAVRLRRGLTQEQLAAAAGLGRTIVSSIERGHAGETALHTVRRVATVLGISVTLAARWRGAETARLLDRAHAELVGAVVRRLSAAGWTVRPEHTFSIYGERGSIDVFAWQPVTAALLCVECKTKLPDLQDVLATMDRKRRRAPEIAALEGWMPVHAASVLVVPDETWARNAVHRSGSVFDAALPARTVQVRRWLDRPHGDLRGIWFLLNDGGTNTRRRPGGQMRVRARRKADSDVPEPTVSSR
jgi:transcriptional regulator with XRE-family HTH domain